jgi:hypothetical protein
MQAAAPPDWAGQTVVCIASGPSLTPEDCDRVRGLRTIVTNTSFRLAPWADVLFGFDAKWWREHIAEVRSVFKGRMLSQAQVASNVAGVESLYGSKWFRGFGNSGACAISVALCAGASRVVLIGYDCGFTPDGKRHWHPDHPNGMSNCKSIARWPYQFGQVAKEAEKRKVPVLNASRQTALKCFARVGLAEALELQTA